MNWNIFRNWIFISGKKVLRFFCFFFPKTKTNKPKKNKVAAPPTPKAPVKPSSLKHNKPLPNINESHLLPYDDLLPHDDDDNDDNLLILPNNDIHTPDIQPFIVDDMITENDTNVQPLIAEDVQPPCFVDDNIQPYNAQPLLQPYINDIQSLMQPYDNDTNAFNGIFPHTGGNMVLSFPNNSTMIDPTITSSDMDSMFTSCISMCFGAFLQTMFQNYDIAVSITPKALCDVQMPSLQ